MSTGGILIAIFAVLLIVIAAIGLALAFVVWLLKRAFTTQHDEDHEHIHGTPL